VLAGTVAERIEIGDQVSQLPEGVNDVGDVRRAVRARRGGAVARRRLPRGEPVLDPGEDQRPALVDRARIPPVVLLEFFDVFCIRLFQFITRN